MTTARSAAGGIVPTVPGATLQWLLGPDNPAVSVLARRTLLGEPESQELAELWAQRNTYGPVATILGLMHQDGSWAPPGRDYQKYGGSLWQIHFLGELHASGADPRVTAAAEYAFSRQLPDGSWSTNGRPTSSLPCLTTNVGRALARLGYARDERVVAALGYCTALHGELGSVDCRFGCDYHLNGHCHMLTPKTLLFLAEVPRELWPSGAEALRDACIDALRDKHVFQSLPAEARAYQDAVFAMPAAEVPAFRERFLAEHAPLTYGPKPGWMRFGYPLSYNSDALEALWALALHDEPPRPEYGEALALVRASATADMRWVPKTSFNGKMLADLEEKGQPSRWLTLRALQVLAHFAE